MVCSCIHPPQYIPPHTPPLTLSLTPYPPTYPAPRSPILLGVRNSDGDIESLCRCLSFTDKHYTEMRERYSEESDNLLPSKPSYVITDERPAVWFKHQEIWEIKGNGEGGGGRN